MPNPHDATSRSSTPARSCRRIYSTTPSPPPMAAAGVNPYQMALEQLKTVAKRMKLDPNLHEVLKHPMRSLEVYLPVRMDNGTIKVFTGYRVQHSMARGPA